MALARRWMVMGGLGAIALGLMGCDGGSATPKPEGSGHAATTSANDPEWKVGAYLSLSGAETEFGVQTREGIELARDEINKAGGIKGKPVKVLFEDNKSTPQETTNKVLQLITRDKVLALIGEVASSRSKAGGIVANKHKIPMITPSSTHPEVTQIGPFVFRVCFTDDEQGRAGAAFVVNKLGKKKIAILYASDVLYSSGLAKEFREEAKKLGAEIVLEKSFLQTETNFTTYINEIKAKNPDVIYSPTYYNHMVPIARQAKAAGLKGDMWVGGDGWDADSLVKDAGEELEGAYFTNHTAADVPWETAKVFRAKYNERFKHDPSSLAIMGYDATKLLFDAMTRAKEMTPDNIRQAIQDTKGFDGASGMVTIDQHRNADKPIVVVQIKDRKFSYYATVKAGVAGAAPPPNAPPSGAPSASAAPSASPVAPKK